MEFEYSKRAIKSINGMDRKARQRIRQAIEALLILLTLVQRFCQDDIATADDIECHHLAMEEHRRGETVRDEDIDWD